MFWYMFCKKIPAFVKQPVEMHMFSWHFTEDVLRNKAAFAFPQARGVRFSAFLRIWSRFVKYQTKLLENHREAAPWKLSQ